MTSNGKDMIMRSLTLYRYITRDGDAGTFASDAEGRKWTNPDNWAYGGLGKAFLAAELYRHTREKYLWDDLIHRLTRIEQRLKEQGSGNYSLYFGRTGLAMLYKRLFDMTKHAPFLARAAAITSAYDSRRLIFKDKSSLAEGTSGFLLFCLSLYNEVKEQWLMDILHRQVELIIDQAELVEKGIYWKGNGITGRCYRGLAYGASGIALALLATGKFFRDSAFLSMADLALQFEDDVTEKEEGDKSHTAAWDWNKKGLIQGELGKRLIRLYRGSLMDRKEDIASWNATILSFNQILYGPLAGDIPMGIANGLSGWGIALHEGSALTKSSVGLDCAHRIGSMLMERSGSALTSYHNSESFAYGLAGIAYSLLQLQSPGPSGFLILPEPAPSITEDAAGKDDGREKEKISLTNPGKRLLSRSMRKSVQMLEEVFPAEMRSFFETPCVPSPGDLVRFARELDMQKLTKDKAIVLAKTIEKEYYLSSINKPLLHGEYPGNNENILKLYRIFRLSREKFMTLRFVVAKDLLLLDQEDALDLDLNKSIPLEMLEHLLMVHGHLTFHFNMNKYNFVEEITLGMMKLFMHLFAREETVNGGMDRFIRFVKLQDKKVLEGLKATLRCSKNSQLIREVKGIFFRNVRTLLIYGILDCTNIDDHEAPKNYSGPSPFIGLADISQQH